MDAKNLIAAICGFALLLTGCMDPSMGPSWRQPEAKPPPPKLETAIVQSQPEAPPAPADEESDLVGQRVRSYIEQVDTISQRARREAAPTPHMAGSSAAEQSRYASTPLSLPPREAPPAPADPAAGPQSVPRPEATIPAPASAPTAPTSAPVLAAVTAREQAAIVTPEVASSPETPSPNAPAVARHAPMSLAQFLQQWPGKPEDSSFRQQLDLRILRAIAGDYEGAREPFSVVSAEQQAMGSRLIDSLIAIRQARGDDQAEGLTEVLTSIDGLRDTLRPLTDLRIPAVNICREVRGFGDYVPIEPPTFSAGSAADFVLYCEIQNFISRQESDGLYHARFEMRTTILNRGGETMLELRDSDVMDSCRNRRNDCFIPRLVRLPATLSPGEYVAKVTVIDKLGEKLAESRASFRVVAR